MQTALNDLRAKNRPHSIKGSLKIPIVVRKVVFFFPQVIKGSLKNPIVPMKATKGYKSDEHYIVSSQTLINRRYHPQNGVKWSHYSASVGC